MSGSAGDVTLKVGRSSSEGGEVRIGGGETTGPVSSGGVVRLSGGSSTSSDSSGSGGAIDLRAGSASGTGAGGATVVSGGRRRPEIGPLVYLPTLLTDVTVGMDLCGQETFGPVASIYVTSDDDHAIQLANDTEYGLNASIVTADVGRGKALARRLNSGSVNINDGYAAAWGSVAAPLGGRGASGLGARHGIAGLLNYTESQTIATQRIWGFSAPAGISDRRWADLLARSVRIMRPLGHRSKGAS